MHSSIIVLALAGLASASTPPGFQPQDSTNLTVAYGSTLAVNGVVLSQNVTASAPTLGTTSHLPNGPYTIMMIDADYPTTLNNGSAGPTTQMLSWLQPGLFSSNSTCTIAGTTVYELVNPQNYGPYGGYLPPNPADTPPYTHRYIQLLLDTSALPVTNESALGLAGIGVRSPFNATLVIQEAGVGVIAANWFNVTNDAALAAGNVTASSSATPSATSTTGTGTTTATATATATQSGSAGAGSGSPSATAASTASGTSASASASAANGAVGVAVERLGWSGVGLVGVLALL